MYEPIPAGEQFAYPNGGTPPMIENHRQILKDRKADFVVTYCREDQYDKKPILKEIEDAGYVLRFQSSPTFSSSITINIGRAFTWSKIRPM